mmetsp:Transcript_147263/g.257274  ORF Transcript_147263/g.257274 Transcript_147263/m.257274 type:complete len:141 (-) Transcript_147263:1486-1908(-)
MRPPEISIRWGSKSKLKPRLRPQLPHKPNRQAAQPNSPEAWTCAGWLAKTSPNPERQRFQSEVAGRWGYFSDRLIVFFHCQDFHRQQSQQVPPRSPGQFFPDVPHCTWPPFDNLMHIWCTTDSCLSCDDWSSDLAFYGTE